LLTLRLKYRYIKPQKIQKPEIKTQNTLYALGKHVVGELEHGSNNLSEGFLTRFT